MFDSVDTKGNKMTLFQQDLTYFDCRVCQEVNILSTK